MLQLAKNVSCIFHKYHLIHNHFLASDCKSRILVLQVFTNMHHAGWLATSLLFTQPNCIYNSPGYMLLLWKLVVEKKSIPE